MFNGIIYHTGVVKIVKSDKKSKIIAVESNLKCNIKDIGSSICCDGVCLTLNEIKKNLIYFYISNETISRSNFKNIKTGKLVNLEKSLIYGQKISGHFIQGHVDTTAKVKKVKFIDKTWFMQLEIKNKNQKKFLVEKASISINGVSLTISKVSNALFNLNIIPHTLKLTNLKKLKVNDIVNVELDIFGKYLFKYTN